MFFLTHKNNAHKPLAEQDVTADVLANRRLVTHLEDTEKH